MVSKARLDLPDPDRPVMTVRLSRGISTSMPLRLCSRAPRTEMWVCIVGLMFHICSRAARVRLQGERTGLNGGPAGAIKRIVGDRFIMRPALAEMALVEGDGVDRKLLA